MQPMSGAAAPAETAVPIGRGVPSDPTAPTSTAARTSLPAPAWTGERRFLAACRRTAADATPVWFMRQAGRALAENRGMRERYSILTLARTPELNAQVSLLPVTAYGVDAAVMYADIMLPLEPMGVHFELDPQVGPIIEAPIRSAADVRRLRPTEPATDVAFVMDALRMVRRELDGHQAVIGFAGGLFTLAAYLIEGRPSRDYATAKAFMYVEPQAWHELLRRLGEMTLRYLRAQVQAGAQALQLFDSWAGVLAPADYRAFVLPHVQPIFEGLAELDVPTIHFATSSAGLLDALVEAGGDVISIDHRQSLADAWQRIGSDRGIQGNLDAARLLAGWEATEAGARQVLAEAGGRPGHIFNLGHGVLPDTDPGVLRQLVEYIHVASARAEEVTEGLASARANDAASGGAGRPAEGAA